MKQLLTIILLVAFYPFAFAQTGVIYDFAFRIDNELVTQMKAQNKDRKILNLATVEEMPKELSDTILFLTESMIGAFKSSTISSMRPEEKLVMAALPEHLMYLPANTFKKALKNNETAELFIDIACHLEANGGVGISFGNQTYSNVKPKISLTIKFFDKEKNLLDKKEAVLKDFEKLRSHTYEKTYGIQGLGQNTDEVTESETLNSNDVLRMFAMAITEALK
jgi:ABC-type proline/glycine betaine transport system ATPase subunit